MTAIDDRIKENREAVVRFVAAAGALPPATCIRNASGALESAISGKASAGEATMDHPFFGTVSLADYVQLQAIHTDHHRGQLPS